MVTLLLVSSFQTSFLFFSRNSFFPPTVPPPSPHRRKHVPNKSPTLSLPCQRGLSWFPDQDSPPRRLHRSGHPSLIGVSSQLPAFSFFLFSHFFFFGGHGGFFFVFDFVLRLSKWLKCPPLSCVFFPCWLTLSRTFHVRPLRFAWTCQQNLVLCVGFIFVFGFISFFAGSWAGTWLIRSPDPQIPAPLLGIFPLSSNFRSIFSAGARPPISLPKFPPNSRLPFPWFRFQDLFSPFFLFLSDPFFWTLLMGALPGMLGGLYTLPSFFLFHSTAARPNSFGCPPAEECLTFRVFFLFKVTPLLANYSFQVRAPDFCLNCFRAFYVWVFFRYSLSVVFLDS